MGGVEMPLVQQHRMSPPIPPGMWQHVPMLPIPPPLTMEIGEPSYELLSPGASPRGVHPCMEDSCCDNISTESTNGASSESDSDDSQASSPSQWSISVKNTFIDVPVQQKFSFAGARQRRRSVPAAFLG